MKQNIKVLFIDDDKLLGKVVVSGLTQKGFDIRYLPSFTGSKEAILNFKPHILILDVEIGDDNGIDIAPEFQLIAPNTPILFVSSHHNGFTIAQALNAGGLSYIKKPFDNEELIAYINKLTIPEATQIQYFASYKLNKEDHTLYYKNELIKRLSPKEFKILSLFIEQANRLISRTQIHQHGWPGENPNELSLNNFIAKLRNYLRKDPAIDIITIPGEGYRLLLKV